MSKTIEISRELAERIAYVLYMHDAERTDAATELDALIAAPVVERQAIGWFTEDHLTDKSATTYDAVVADRWRAKGWTVQPLYTSPPAPVAVVLPERKSMPRRDDYSSDVDGTDEYFEASVRAEEHNACLDKVGDLNQSAEPANKESAQ